MTKADMKRLFAEWTEDYAARLREERQAESPSPSPSEIVDRQRQQPTEQDKGRNNGQESGGRRM